MTAELNFQSSVVGEGEMDDVQAILHEAFNSPPSYLDFLRAEIGDDMVRVTRDSSGSISAAGIMLPMGQYFHGKSVPTVCLAAIATATESRGRGVAIEWMRMILRVIREMDVPISTLYPAARSLYRKAGYDIGGYFVLRQADPRLLNVFEKEGRLVPIKPEHHGTVRELYRVQAERANGLLDRPAWKWKQLLEDAPDREPLFRYLAFDENDEPGGDIIYRVAGDSANGKAGFVEDVCVCNATAGRRLVSLVAQTRSQLGAVSWPGGERSLFDTLIPERSAVFPRYLPWFLRIIDVKAALGSRGWNKAVRASLDIELIDDDLAENAGRWRLELENGEMKVTRGGDGDVRLHTRALASLYGSARDSRHLETLGLLDATDDQHDLIDAIFCGPTAWMPDRF